MTGRLWLLLGCIFAWWFFMGDGPAEIARNFVGRGRKLSSTTMRNGRDLDQTVDEVVSQVNQAMGRKVERDAVILARVIANEHPGCNQREAGAIGWVCLNDARAHFGGDLEQTTTTARGCWGTQKGRRYSSHGEDVSTFQEDVQFHVRKAIFEIHEGDLYVAESILNGSIKDITGGATNFVHVRPREAFADFLLGHPNVKKWLENGLRPVWLGDVSTLVILLPAAKITSDMSTLDPNVGAA
jgi:hypothetical protein